MAKAEPWLPTAWRRVTPRFCSPRARGPTNMSRASEGGRVAAEEARRDAERAGMEVGRLRPCVSEGLDGTRLTGCRRSTCPGPPGASGWSCGKSGRATGCCSAISPSECAPSPEGRTGTDCLRARPPPAARPLAVSEDDEGRVVKLIAGLHDVFTPEGRCALAGGQMPSSTDGVPGI